jgi:hypothetical protein
MTKAIYWLNSHCNHMYQQAKALLRPRLRAAGHAAHDRAAPLSGQLVSHGRRLPGGRLF